MLGCALSAQAQWITQVNNLKAGWNAVYLHVDASYTNLNELVGKDAANPIQEIWQWQPALPTGQFTESPQLPTGTGTSGRIGQELKVLPRPCNCCVETQLTSCASPMRRLLTPGKSKANLWRLPIDGP